jgi:benzoyl-CoA-dihydrodiol lyase
MKPATPITVSATPTSACYPMVTGQSRLGRRFYDEQPALDAVRAKAGQPLDADAAFALGLVTSNPDDIDWADEVRIASRSAWR